MERVWGGLAFGMALTNATIAVSAPFEMPEQASLVATRDLPSTEIVLPTSPFDPTTINQSIVRGDVEQRVYQFTPSTMTSLQIVDILRPELVAAGYTITFECKDISCGGFDFRFALDVIGEPYMHVDLGDFRYAVAFKETTEGTQAIAVLASRSANNGFVQITTVLPEMAQSLAAPNSTKRAEPLATKEDLGKVLETEGRAVLYGLSFERGSAELGDGPFKSLRDLAVHLQENPNRRVFLVGHTDAEGSLAGNTTLSRNRANAVRRRLIDNYDVPVDQLAGVEGVGFLMPLASNETAAGREQNRRVEVVLAIAE